MTYEEKIQCMNIMKENNKKSSEEYSRRYKKAKEKVKTKEKLECIFIGIIIALMPSTILFVSFIDVIIN